MKVLTITNVVKCTIRVCVTQLHIPSPTLRVLSQSCPNDEHWELFQDRMNEMIRSLVMIRTWVWFIWLWLAQVSTLCSVWWLEAKEYITRTSSSSGNQLFSVKHYTWQSLRFFFPLIRFGLERHKNVPARDKSRVFR